MLCDHLRWKSRPLDIVDEARVVAVLKHGGQMYTCACTAQVVGPDDDLAAPERCSDRRGCYRPSPLLRRSLPVS
jgi:hypothetical protein